MRPHPLLLAAVLCAVPLPSLAQDDATRSAVARLTADLDVSSSLRGEMEAGLATLLGGDELRYDGRQGSYSVMGCEETEMRARLVDLNGDDTPEVQVEAGGTCVGGMAGTHSWLLVRTPGGWRADLAFPGFLVPLGTRSGGFVDVLVAGPGFCFPVWRWNGRAYDHFCNAGEGGANCDSPCPRAINVRDAGEELPAFRAAAPR